jgi:hypothetical protein
MPSETGNRNRRPATRLAAALAAAALWHGSAGAQEPRGGPPADDGALGTPAPPGDLGGELGTPGSGKVPFGANPPTRRVLAHYEFLEDNYLNYFLPARGPAGDEPLVFEAQTAPHLFLWNQWEKVQSQPTWSGGWVNDLALTFVFRMRMVNDYSAPVRPPSFMPRIDYQAFRIWKTRTDEVHLLELRLTPWGHHSNGQQHCSFVEGLPGGDPATEPCVPVDPSSPPTDKVNYRSGDFSTSFFVVGAHYAFIGLDGDKWEKSRLAGGVLFEGNPRPWGPGTIGELMSKLYGPWRLRLDLEARRHVGAILGRAWLAGMLSVSGSAEIMWKTAPRIPSDRETLEASWAPDRLHGPGLFVRFFTGQDYMNILFAAGRTTMVQFGIVWILSPPVQYTFEPKPGA